MDTFEDRFDHEPTNEEWDADDLDESDPDVRAYTSEPKVYKATQKSENFHLSKNVILSIFILLAIIGGVIFFLKSDKSKEKVVGLVQNGKKQTIDIIQNFTKVEDRPKIAPETNRYKLNNITNELKNVEATIKQEFSKLTEEKKETPTEEISKKPAEQKANIVSNVKTIHQAPVVINSSNQQSSQKSFNLPKRGKLIDFRTAVQKDPALKDFLINADVYSFKKLNEFRPFVQSLIKKWAQSEDIAEIEKIIEMNFETFTTLTEVNLLPFTTLKKIGLTPSYDLNLVKENAHEISSAFYINLQPILDNIKDIDEKIDYVEPLSDFLIYHCARKQQCMMEWETLIELLGLSEYKNELLTP
ncbi:MAG: hypothetical protein MJ250_07430 [Alphaproteobacteria bacterium]|nr:hypothetical protein [Alphaproteobacteria bacterium]